MKNIILALALVAAMPVLAEEPSAIKDSVKSIISGVVSSGKDALSGVKTGVDEGRKTGDSIDSAVIITDKEGLNKFIEISVLSATKVGDEDYEITLALRNKSDKSVRLSNLNEAKSLVLLDSGGFASLLKTPLSPDRSEVLVPDNAAVKVRYVFAKVDDVPAMLRVYGVNVPVPTISAK